MRFKHYTDAAFSSSIIDTGIVGMACNTCIVVNAPNQYDQMGLTGNFFIYTSHAPTTVTEDDGLA